MNVPSVTQLVRERTAELLYARDGSLWYSIVPDGSTTPFVFPVPFADVGTATFRGRERAIMLMRWIRRHREALLAEDGADAGSGR